jgi:predicted ATPase
MKKIVLTGAPSSWKTTLINNLSSKGFSVVPESAMQVIWMYQNELGGVQEWKEYIRPNWVIDKQNFRTFIERTIDLQQKQEAGIWNNWEYIFLDRWIPDYLSFAELRDIDVPNSIRELMVSIASSYSQVIHLPVVPERFVHRANSGRVITLEEALAFDSINRKMWESCKIGTSIQLVPGNEQDYVSQVTSLIW